jgi:hypothetical protein
MAMCSGISPKERHAEFGRILARPTMAEDMRLMPTLGTDVGGHVFHDAQNRNLDLLEHGNALARIDERQILRRGDDHRAIQRHLLRDGQLRVAGARWHVDEQHIQGLIFGRPGHIGEHLCEGGNHHRRAPHHGRALGDQKAHRHDFDAMANRRCRLLAFIELGRCRNPKKSRDRRPVNIGVEHADTQTLGGQSDGEIGGRGRFADPALTGRDSDDRADAGKIDATNTPLVGRRHAWLGRWVCPLGRRWRRGRLNAGLRHDAFGRRLCTEHHEGLLHLRHRRQRDLQGIAHRLVDRNIIGWHRKR